MNSQINAGSGFSFFHNRAVSVPSGSLTVVPPGEHLGPRHVADEDAAQAPHLRHAEADAGGGSAGHFARPECLGRNGLVSEYNEILSNNYYSPRLGK